MGAGEVRDLLVPARRLTAELMDKDNWISIALVVAPKPYPVGGYSERHDSPGHSLDIAGVISQL